MSDATPAPPAPKSLLKSKTFWLQIATFAAVFYPPVQLWLAANPETFVAALGAVNILVRFATKGAITIFGDGDPNGSGGVGER